MADYQNLFTTQVQVRAPAYTGSAPAFRLGSEKQPPNRAILTTRCGTGRAPRQRRRSGPIYLGPLGIASLILRLRVHQHHRPQHAGLR